MYKHQEWLIATINRHKFQKVVEVGVDIATTSEIVIQNCPSITDYYMVDPWTPYTTGTCGCYLKRSPERWDEIHQIACDRVKDFPQGRVMRMPSLEGAEQFELCSLDLVFIDGDHSYEAVMADIAAWQPLVRPGGILSGHDYGAFGVAQAVQESFPNGEFTTTYPQGSVWMVQI